MQLKTPAPHPGVEHSYHRRRKIGSFGKTGIIVRPFPD